MARLVIALGVFMCLAGPCPAADNPAGSNARSAGAVEIAKDLPAAAASRPNQWVKLDKADVNRPDAPLVYDPELKRFMVLGGSVSWSEYAKPHPFDVLALDVGSGRWENWIPPGKRWGPARGDCQAPRWKSESWGLLDAEGNCRPNLTVYRGLWLYNQYALDTDSKRVYFYARGSTFCYDPAARAWTDLAPANHPAHSGGTLLWGSMCYIPHIKKILLFGGGNVQTERGDPGTWTYDPAANAWQQLPLERQPTQRALSPMIYDEVNKQVVLFGGDRLDQLLSDTWTFDGRKWEEKKPATAPGPRGGHALLWLPRAKRVLLLGGYGYDSAVGYYPAVYRDRPLEAWTFDAAGERWQLVAAWSQDCPPARAPHPLRAAAGGDDLLAVVAGPTWLCKLDVTGPDRVAAEDLAVRPGTVERRKQWCDPQWYRQAPPADAARTAAELDTLPVNRWVMRSPPRRPGYNVDWGSAVYDPHHDLILRFSGGHCAYSGTAPQVYDVKTDRWSIPFAPEMPLEFCSSNDQVPGEWSFTGSPWMSGHTYKTTGYEPQSKTLVFAARGYTYFFDPAQGRWSQAAKPSPFRANMYVTTLCTTPRGVVAWAEHTPSETGLFLLAARTRQWNKLPLAGTLPRVSADEHGMAYDSRRDRLLLLSGADKLKGDVMAYDMKSGAARWLGAAGKGRSGVRSRETIYLPEYDAVLIGNTIADDDGERLWPLYDCRKNAWFGVRLGGEGPIGKDGSMVSLGLMYDPARKLVWAVDQTNRVFVLKLDPQAGPWKKLE
ncbi:MAG: kelch repeat-containing protein [Thermoguttaceae bacterium]|jgi:hypothetical protein